MKCVILRNDLAFVMSWATWDKDDPFVFEGRFYGFDSRGFMAERFDVQQLDKVLGHLQRSYPNNWFVPVIVTPTEVSQTSRDQRCTELASA